MKFTLCIALVLLWFQYTIEAFPPQVRLHRLPYFRRPSQAAQPIRLRRNALDSSLNKMPSSTMGDTDVSLEFIQSNESPEQNIIVTTFTTDNSANGLVSKGVAHNNIHNQKVSSSTHDDIKQTTFENFYKDDSNYEYMYKLQKNLVSGFLIDPNYNDIEWSHGNSNGLYRFPVNIPKEINEFN